MTDGDARPAAESGEPHPRGAPLCAPRVRLRRKRVAIKEDGRYLIYYEFCPAQAAEAAKDRR